MRVIQTVIPLGHDLVGEHVLVFGGGPVGARKARHFGQEATVTVVSESFVEGDFGGAERVQATLDEAAVVDWVERTDPALVVAATDDRPLNATIERLAGERGILCNRADVAGDRDAGSVVVPATVRADPVVVSVSTGGRSPALSRHLRERIEPTLANAGAMADLTGELRTALRDGSYGPERRQQAMRAVVESDRVWTALDTDGTNTRDTAVAVIAEETGIDLGGASP